MSILVTGASGFVGAHIIDTLLASGKEVILAADLESAPSPVEDRRVQHLALDVTDAGAVRRLIGSMRPEAVVHAAAVTPSLEEEATQADRIVAVNAGGSANVAAAALASGVRRLVLFSSSAVYNGLEPGVRVVTEDRPLPHPPASLYAVTKIACEGLAYRFAAAGLSVCALRVASVYGEHERATGSRKAARLSQLHRFSTATAAGMPLRLHGPNAGRDWAHGSDVARAIIGLLAAPSLNHIVYNVGSGQAAGFHEIARLFRAEGMRESNSPDALEIAMQAGDERPALSVVRLAADTGYAPSVPLEQGIPALVAHHRRELAR